MNYKISTLVASAATLLFLCLYVGQMKETRRLRIHNHLLAAQLTEAQHPVHAVSQVAAHRAKRRAHGGHGPAKIALIGCKPAR